MRTTNQQIGKNKRLFAEVYENPTEFIRIVGGRSLAWGNKDSLSDEAKGSDWAGYDNGIQLKADFLASKCDESKVAKMRSSMRISATRTKKRTVFYNDVAGFAPVVPLALIGVPEAMRNGRMMQMKTKVIDVYIDCTASASYGCDELAEAGCRVIEEVVALEMAGYRANVTALFTSVMHHDVGCVGVKIKDAGQPLDVARVAYPFINPSFMRGICFGWYERCNEIEHEWGYGTCLAYKEWLIPSFKTAVCGKNGVFLQVADVLNHGAEAVKNALAEYTDKGVA